jgi:hypothetical protein
MIVMQGIFPPRFGQMHDQIDGTWLGALPFPRAVETAAQDNQVLQTVDRKYDLNLVN